MTQLAESMGGFWSTPANQTQYIDLEEFVAKLHLEEGSPGTEMVFDTDATETDI